MAEIMMSVGNPSYSNLTLRLHVELLIQSLFSSYINKLKFLY